VLQRVAEGTFVVGFPVLKRADESRAQPLKNASCPCFEHQKLWFKNTLDLHPNFSPNEPIQDWFTEMVRH
jgi:hypothetical protein